MFEYPATLLKVLDGETVDLNVEISAGQIVPHRVRLKGVQTQNISKQYHTSFKGATGVFAKLKVIEWFYNRSLVLTVQEFEKDICGRILGVVFAAGDEISINVYMIENFYYSADWELANQQSLKAAWFAGEVVTVPQGDQLPIFHAWGKNIFIGFNSLIF
jgi:endonuclease YncB( thermonuclease family)